MDTPEEFTRRTMGMIGHVLNELVAHVGILNARIEQDESDKLETNAELDDLYALTQKVVEAFPPLPMNGHPS